MIAFNGQYLPAASHGNMRITAACLGGQWVIDNRYMTPATQQAIIAAFGAEEGIAVISRTNDYLNALAITDTTRALQLAMFIQEDPLLVTSLVETSKTRWLVGDGKAYVDTGVVPGGRKLATKSKFYINGTNTTWATMVGSGVRDNTDNYRPICKNTSTNQWRLKIGGYNTYYPNADNQPHTVEVNTPQGMFIYDGEVLDSTTQRSVPASNTRSLWIFDDNGGGGNNATGGCAYVQITEQEDIAHFIPYNNGTECGMLDIISGTFYPNANAQGSFTIAITDKTHA